MSVELAKPHENDVFNWETFQTKLGNYSEQELLQTKLAFDFAINVHQGQFRTTDNSPYFSHVRSTAEILIDECEVTDPYIIQAALLHDVLEDAGKFNNDNAWSDEKSTYLTSLGFNPESVKIVKMLTKPDLQNADEVRSAYLSQLENATPVALLVKMADRLHNLRTSDGLPLAKKRKLYSETINNFIPIFETVNGEFSEASKGLISNMKEELSKLENNIYSSSNHTPAHEIPIFVL